MPHSDVKIVHCSKCNREGSRRQNGVPAAWRREYKDEEEVFLCPTCWSVPRLRLVTDAD